MNGLRPRSGRRLCCARRHRYLVRGYVDTVPQSSRLALAPDGADKARQAQLPMNVRERGRQARTVVGEAPTGLRSQPHWVHKPSAAEPGPKARHARPRGSEKPKSGVDPIEGPADVEGPGSTSGTREGNSHHGGTEDP